MTTAHLAGDLRIDEGLRLKAYPDPLTGGAPWTIGYGHTGPEVHRGLVWNLNQAEAALAADIAHAEALCDAHIPWWRGLADARQDVLVNMMFNMGWLSPDHAHGLGTFVHTLQAMHEGRYDAAAAGMLNSGWAHQVHDRAQRLAHQMATGVR